MSLVKAENSTNNLELEFRARKVPKEQSLGRHTGKVGYRGSLYGAQDKATDF